MRRILRNQKGAALPVVLAITVAGTLVALGLLGFLLNEVTKSQTVSEGIQAKYAAEAGAERMLYALRTRSGDLITLEPLACSTISVTQTSVNDHDIETSCSLTEDELTLSSTATGEQTHTTTVTLNVKSKAPLTLEVSTWE